MTLRFRTPIPGCRATDYYSSRSSVRTHRCEEQRRRPTTEGGRTTIGGMPSDAGRARRFRHRSLDTLTITVRRDRDGTRALFANGDR